MVKRFLIKFQACRTYNQLVNTELAKYLSENMSQWKSSIVTYIDLIGIKGTANKHGSRATDLMRQLHSIVEIRMFHGMPNHDHCYLWNDSVLLLSYLESPYRTANETEILKEADDLKKEIDQLSKSYAISVKGQVFPDEPAFASPSFDGKIVGQPRVVKLRTSSYAMGNCFLIEEKLGKKLKQPWYVDSRIARHLVTNQKLSKHTLEMLPDNIAREVYVYEGYLW